MGRDAAAAPFASPPPVPSNPNHLNLNDVMQQCLYANRAVEHIVATSPLRIASLSPREHPQPHHPSPARSPSLPSLPRAQAHSHSPLRTTSAPRSLTPSSRFRQNAGPSSVRRLDSPAKRRNSTPGQRLVIHRGLEPDDADILTCRGGARKTAKSPVRVSSTAAVEKITRRMEKQEAAMRAQALLVNELLEVVEYTTLISGIDWRKMVVKNRRQREDFFKVTPEGGLKKGVSVALWSRIAGYLDDEEVFKWRLMRKANCVMAKTAGLCYLSWFKGEKVRRMFVNSTVFTSFWVPGATKIRVLLEGKCEAKCGAKLLHDRDMVDAPCRIQVKGVRSYISLVTNTAHHDVGPPSPERSLQPKSNVQSELPQGRLELRSVNPDIHAIFKHDRWYPLPGDGVALVPVDLIIDPLSDLSAQPKIVAWISNDKLRNPWTFKFDAKKQTKAKGDAVKYQIRYFDSLARQLAVSEAFTL